MTAGAVKVPGVAMVFGGREYIVPPLNLAAARQHREAIAGFFAAGVPDLEVAAKVLHAALRRNHPEVTEDDVAEWVDFGNVIAVMEAVMNLSGMVAAAGNLMGRIQSAMSPASQTPPTPTA